MKKIDVKYNLNGYIDEVSDNSIHFEQENDSLQIDAQIATDKKVRAYIKAPNNNSTVTDELTPVDGVYSCVVEGDYMSKGTLYIGYEIYDDTGYIERLEPLKVYIDGFVNIGGGSSDNVYVVTIKVGNVKTLANGEPATVENVGTKKDMILNFGLPRGEQGIKGDKGDTGPQGEKGDKGDQGIQGVQGVSGKDGLNGKDGYTPKKGVDYFTAEDIESLGIKNKVDKVAGKGLSANDFTNALKERLENNTFDYYIEPAEYEEEFDYDSYTNKGIYLLHKDNVSDDTERPYYILTVSYYYDFSVDEVPCVTIQTLLNLITGEVKHRDDFGGKWNPWTKVSVSQADLNKAIGDVEKSLDNIIEKYGLGGESV